MNKMKNAQKGLIIAGIILVLTLGMFILKNYILSGPEGFRLATPLDAVLALPALPFLLLYLVFPTIPTEVLALMVILITIAFWLLVGYGIGKWMDNKKK